MDIRIERGARTQLIHRLRNWKKLKFMIARNKDNRACNRHGCQHVEGVSIAPSCQNIAQYQQRIQTFCIKARELFMFMMQI